MARTAILLIVLAAAAAAEHVREFVVRENARAATVVGHLGDDVPDAAPPYTIVPVPGSAVFEDLEIDFNTGEIRTRVLLDREYRDHYAMIAIPASGDNIKVLVKVLDENDNAPVFPTPIMNVEFSENTPRDVKRKLNSAKDNDLGIFNTQRYNIVSGNTDNAFRLSSHRERDGVLYLDLQINGYLDRETIDHYELVIEALDGGSPPLRGTMTVNITILDVNDNPPIFAETSYSAIIPENATVGTTVLKVSAVDADLGENGQIEYSINRRQSDKENMFKIDALTGEITVNKALDFETKELHELVVVARDKGAQPLETTAFVSIRVTDVNDNQPTINVIFLSDDTKPKISEAAQINEFAARISVHDPDSKTEYSNVNVTLEGGDGHFSLRTNDNIIYFIVVASPLDREKQSSYTLKIVATDKGSPPLHASRIITLKVTDINDNTPVFSENEYTVEVAESASIGTPVIQMSATDLDEGENADIRYSLLQTPQSEWFAIDERSGLVTVKSKVACETNPAPRLTVVASDRGEPPLSSTAVLVVTVLDVNDNEPIFDQSFYNVTVPENEAIGSCVLKISAIDPDCGVNSVVNYTLGTTFTKSQFIIKRDTGELCVADNLDYEASSEIELPILATDRGGLSTTGMVKIQLLDINDNVPIFNTADYSVTLKEGRITTDDPIVAVSASDKDSDRFGEVSYRIVGGNIDEIFRIERGTGEIFVAKPNLIHRESNFNLKVSAIDGGGASSHLPANVKVTVMKAGSGSVFDKAIYNFRVKEDIRIGSTVGVIKSKNDKGSHARNFIIASGDPENYFKVQFPSGTIMTTRHLDRETKSLFLLNIQAVTDSSHQFDQTQVFIIIEDVNDNAPEFGFNTIRVSVAESAHIGSMVYAARATDLDEGKNAHITYTLASAIGPPNTFAVNQHTGMVTLLRSLDYEHLVRHTLIIMAKDNGTPSLSGNLTLVIDVQDVNDNPPVFEHDSYVANVLESEPVGTKIIEIQAIDKDTGNNARITYRIITETDDSQNDLFGIDSSTGWIFIASPLDREMSHLHKLKVTATDNGLPPKSTSTYLTITILDANDNDPVFLDSSYKFEVEENKKAGSFVGKVSATDADVGKNAALKFSLFPTNTSFIIDSVTGVITTKEKLDREYKSTYSIFAEAKDKGTPQRSNRVPVLITVCDVNDNPPEIIDPREDVVSVREEQQPGAEVARVKAIDRDNGVNSSIKYSLVKERDSDGFDVFVIDSKTGVIRTSTVLDHEERSIYRLTVAATDSGSPPKETVRQLKVEVLDLNDNRPTFTSSSLSFKVKEDAEIGHIVGKISCCDREISENFISGDLERHISFLIMPITQDHLPGTFEIDRRTGSLVVARKLDREIQDEYRLEVRALDTSATNNPQSSAINVRIEIIDVNDNAPEWPQDPISIEITEIATIGTVIYNFTAKDRDIGLNADLNYSLHMTVPELGNTFSLDSLTGSLILTSPLDYETLTDYWFVIKATDMATDPMDRISTAVTVHVKVIDANDNAPKFVSSNEIYVSRNSLGNVFYQALAVDFDSGDNGKLSYFISSGNKNGYFTIESETGKLSLSKKFTTDMFKTGPKQYELNITATDHANFIPKQSQMTLVIGIRDATNAPPKFEKQSYEVQINEAIRIGNYVTTVSAVTSSGNSGYLMYHIPEGVAEDKFAINSRSGTITVNGNIDREEKNHYRFPVYVSESTSILSSVYDVAIVSVNILDYNDNAPMFKPGSCYRLSIPENNDPDVIHTIAAIDKDIGVNGQIIYSIIGGNTGNKFSIDSKTGKLTAKTLDRESQSKYHLTISAYDKGNPVALQGLCNLTISVEDQNDNDPKFETNTYKTILYENATIDTSVIQVRANDYDAGLNGRIVYSLANESQGLFRIDNKTGIIYTTGLFDREKEQYYKFTAVATDQGRYLARSQSVDVEIDIMDINDNQPIFAQYPFRGKIATLSPRGQLLLKVQATDNDLGINSEIIYELVENSNNKFRISPTTGELTATQSLASENGNLVHLKVMAKDKGNPPQSSIGLIEIRIGEFPDTLPSLNFRNATYNISIPENHPNGKEIVQVTAVRSDGRRQRIIYEIGSGNDQYAFEIDHSTGIIRISNSELLDYESFSGPKRKLVVVARTENAPVLYGYTEVTINLVDQNDNAPRFTQQQYVANVFEGNTKGEFVVQLTAKDSDQGANARILYHIVDGNHDNAFIIEPAFSGSVKTNIVLDREIRDSYKLTVIATDEGDPQMTGTATLRINVVDINDNQPTFPPPNVISISEGTPLGSVLTTITANDVDTYPALKYSISEEDGKFSIDRYSGRLVLNKPLDFETNKLYELNIAASDSQHETKTVLTIKVTDDNDNAPIFENVAYSSALTEITGTQQLLTVTAKDIDSGENSNITYTFLEPKKGFSIDAFSGVISVNYTELPTNQKDAELVAVASDQGKPKKSARSAVRISLGGTSDIRPYIGQDSYRITVKEDTERGSSLLKLGDIHDGMHNIHFQIISGNEGGFFDITNDGSLILINELDRESQDAYVLGLAALKQGKMYSYNHNRTSVTVHISISDANDNAPQFATQDFELNVSEDINIGHTLIQLSTSDADLYGSPNAEVNYEVTSGDDEKLFYVNPKTGVLTVNKTLDYDIDDTEYKLVIVACDNGLPTLCNVAYLKIGILDENDNTPTFPVTEYFESIGENERVGTSIFTARATDLDRGKFGKLNYSIIPSNYRNNEDSSKMFEIDPISGIVNSNAVFDYEQQNKYELEIKAIDLGGKSSIVRVRIDIESRDEFYPQFTQKTYNFNVPISGSLPVGYFIGQVVATDRDKGIDGRIAYQFSTLQSYFKINRTTGVIIMKKRADSIANLFGSDKSISLVVTASSGRQGSLTNKTAVEIKPDPSAVYSDINQDINYASSGGLSDWALGLLIAFIFIIIIFAAAFLFLHMKNKRHKKVNKPGLNSEGVGASNSYVDPSAFDTIPIRNTGPVSANQFAPPKYDEIPPYGPHTASSNSGAATTSELSGSDQSGSSGRGSAEDGEDGEDEEIRMINEGPLQRNAIRRPNGVDDDNLSDVSVHNTQEYLARLGIVDSGTAGGASTSSRRCSGNVTKDPMLHHGPIDHMQMFDEDANNENDITNLIYAKLNEVTGSDRASSTDETNAVDRSLALGAFPNAPGGNTGVPTQGPSMTGSLSSIVHSEEELTGSYNWDYLLDWGPQYQPLAHVFSEIARLKDDTVSLQSGNSAASSVKSKGTSLSGGKNVPPPLLTTVAPRSCPAPSLACRQPQHLSPRSPISHDMSGGFSVAAAMSPSFSPSLSPLATRSPSMSPLVGPGLPPSSISRKPQHSTLRL